MRGRGFGHVFTSKSQFKSKSLGFQSHLRSFLGFKMNSLI